MLSQLSANTILYLGICLLLLSLVLKIAQQPSTAALQPPSETFNQAELPKKNAGHLPIQISIDNYITTDITSETYDNGIWSVSATSASHLSSSAYPNEAGNIIIYGHNKQNILGKLPWLKGDETISLQLADGSQRKYQITHMQKIGTDQTQFLKSTDSELLTIYTCTGPLDSQRYIVQATPIEDIIEVPVASDTAALAPPRYSPRTVSQVSEIITKSLVFPSYR